jgi:hypothetical protein
MDYIINLFGYNSKCSITTDNNDLIIKLAKEEQEQIKDYLKRVLFRYSSSFTEESETLADMIKRAVEVEKQMGGRMSEPRIKLPYEFSPEIKEKLIEAADIQETSATQLLVRLIEQKYKSIMNKKGGI